MYQSIINYKGARYFWIALILSLASIAAYWWDDPINSPNGGTWLGYTLGTIGALLIVWLMLLGIRKRSYRSSMGTVQGWTSAHVYLGTALLLVATLHCGMQFGNNVHTLAYVLMVVVIFSGFFGIYAYIRYPNILSDLRGGDTLDDMLAQIEKTDARSLREANTTELKELISNAIEGCSVGGSAWKQLRATDSSVLTIPATFDTEDRGTTVKNTNQEKIISVLADRLSNISGGGQEAGAIQNILANFASKQTLLRRVRRDTQIRALLKVWLYFHVPLSFALLAALAIHIIVVFYYW